MKLSKNFSLEEFTSSQTATRKGIDNTPTPLATINLIKLVTVLEQIRSLVSSPITVSSGYRSPILNKAIGGSSTSAHVLGLAADITSRNMTPKQLAKIISTSCINFDQLIYEGTWVHVGLSNGKPRKQILTATFKKGKASYTVGIN